VQTKTRGAHGRGGARTAARGACTEGEGAHTGGEGDAHGREGGCARVGMGVRTTVAFTNFRV
jgi:hypothetical protein